MDTFPGLGVISAIIYNTSFYLKTTITNLNLSTIDFVYYIANIPCFFTRTL